MSLSDSPIILRSFLRWLCLPLLFFALGGVSAAEPTELFEQANKLYEQGKFKEAAKAYQQLAKTGNGSAPLYFNLGNAFFKSGQIGQAIAAYRQAEQLAPRDMDLRANLQFARKTVNGDGPIGSDRWKNWLSMLALDEWTWLAVGAGWLWFSLRTLGEWRLALKKSFRGYTTATGVGFALLLAVLSIILYVQSAVLPAVVVVREAVVRYGPLEESPSFFLLRDGMEVEVLDQKGEWLQVLDAKKRKGWVLRQQMLLIPVRGGKNVEVSAQTRQLL